MQQPSFFLRTKLLPPRAVPDFLERPRLTEKLRANLAAPLTMIAADAGCGKTTLVADFLRQQDRPFVWYQLDHTDADPVVFLGYIAHGIREIVPGFGDIILPYLAEANEELLSVPERAVDLLINEVLQSVEQPILLVLDDYHHIGRDTVVHKLIDRLLQYSSDILHLIITTRDVPPLAIMRRRSQSAALVLTRDDLLFTDEEVRGLFRQSLNVDLGEDEINEYRGRTHGWITALQLVRQVAEQEIHSNEKQQTPDLHKILLQTEKDIFDYFAEEVFAREEPETRQMLARLSLLETLQLNACGELFPEMRCSAALPELAQKNIFLTAAGDGRTTEEYRFHPLFRDFLRRKLRSEWGHARVADERTRIAEYFLGKEQWDIALSYLLDAEKFERAAEVIAETGHGWISAGAFTALGLMAERVPQNALEKFPRALLHKAEIARLRGDIERSGTLFNRAVTLLREASDGYGEAEGLHALASLARRRRQHAEAYELLQRAESLVQTDSETYMKCANTRGLCLIAEGCWSEAEQQFRIALELAEKNGNEHFVRLVTHNLALAPGFRGDFGEALRWFKRIFRTDQPDKQLPQEAIGHLNVARLHLYRGEFEETEKHLERSLELCQLYNLGFLRGEIYEAIGNFHREKMDLAHAEAFYERALSAYDEAEIDIVTKEIDEERATLFRLKGDLPRARAILENHIAGREARGDTSGANKARLRLYQVFLAEGTTAGLPEVVENLAEYFHREELYYDEALSFMLLAEAHFALDPAGPVLAAVQRALDLALRFDYEYWLRREIELNPELFSLEDVFEILPPDLRSAVTDGAKRRAVPGTNLAAEGPMICDLTINLLGHVEIYRDPSYQLPPDAWTTRRARDILCYIATSKYRRVPKDVLVEAFWNGEDLQTIEKNFHPTISHIRKALNLSQPFKQNFLVFRDGAYQLNPDLVYSIDTEEFEKLISQAEAAKREKDAERLRDCLEAAHKLYRGDFMSGVYEEWAEERRNFYSEQFVRICGALAKLNFGEKRWSAALANAKEVLAIDPFREDMHRMMLKILAAQGKTSSVRKHYEELAALLKTELGVEPAAQTVTVYRELVK